jgi:hypothetical protein
MTTKAWHAAVVALHPKAVFGESAGVAFASTGIQGVPVLVGVHSPAASVVSETSMSAPFERAGLEVKFDEKGGEFVVKLYDEADIEKFHEVADALMSSLGVGDIDYKWDENSIEGCVLVAFKLAEFPETKPGNQNDAKTNTKFKESRATRHLSRNRATWCTSEKARGTFAKAEAEQLASQLGGKAVLADAGKYAVVRESADVNASMYYFVDGSNDVLGGPFKDENAAYAWSKAQEHPEDYSDAQLVYGQDLRDDLGLDETQGSPSTGYRVWFTDGTYAAYQTAASEEDARARAAKDHPACDIDRVDSYALKDARMDEANEVKPTPPVLSAVNAWIASNHDAAADATVEQALRDAGVLRANEVVQWVGTNDNEQFQVSTDSRMVRINYGNALSESSAIVTGALVKGKSYVVYTHNPFDNEHAVLLGHFRAVDGEDAEALKARVAKDQGGTTQNLYVLDGMPVAEAATDGDLDAALQYLQQLINQGVEYPDAQFKAAAKFKVSPDELQAAYDALFEASSTMVMLTLNLSEEDQATLAGWAEEQAVAVDWSEFGDDNPVVSTDNAEWVLGAARTLGGSAVVAETATPMIKDFEEWQAAVRAAHPELKLSFKSTTEHGEVLISAEVRGQDRSYGEYNMETEEGYLFKDLEESANTFEIGDTVVAPASAHDAYGEKGVVKAIQDDRVYVQFKGYARWEYATKLRPDSTKAEATDWPAEYNCFAVFKSNSPQNPRLYAITRSQAGAGTYDLYSQPYEEGGDGYADILIGMNPTELGAAGFIHSPGETGMSKADAQAWTSKNGVFLAGNWDNDFADSALEAHKKLPTSFDSHEEFSAYVLGTWPNRDTHVEDDGDGVWSASIGGDPRLNLASYDASDKSVTWGKMNPSTGDYVEITEAAGVDYPLYHKTYSSAVQSATLFAQGRGYEIDIEDYFRKIAVGPRKPAAGDTNSFSVELLKDGKPSKKMLHMQIYNMDDNRYELNCYVEARKPKSESTDFEVSTLRMLGFDVEDLALTRDPVFSGQHRWVQHDIVTGGEIAAQDTELGDEDKSSKTPDDAWKAAVKYAQGVGILAAPPEEVEAELPEQPADPMVPNPPEAPFGSAQDFAESADQDRLAAKGYVVQKIGEDTFVWELVDKDGDLVVDSGTDSYPTADAAWQAVADHAS